MEKYHVGDKVIHWYYGLGEILKMDEKFINERQQLCYVVRIDDLTIWVKADDPDSSSIRPPTPESDFETLFEILSGPGDRLPVDRFERKTQLVERMRDGDLASVCSVIRDLAFYRQEKKLNESDKYTLDRAQTFLLSEWMYSLSVPFVQAYDELTRLLGAVQRVLR